MSPGALFLYVCCQVGAEKALKEELSITHPEWRFAFSRPGFLTFKWVSAHPLERISEFRLHSVFARCWGFSVGPQKSVIEASQAIRSLAQTLGQTRLGLEVWERDLYPVGEEPRGFQPGALAHAWQSELANHLSDLLEQHERISDWIADFSGVAAENSEFWVGYHFRTARSRAQGPGGSISVVMPEDSPSRAFIKLEQAIAWSGLQLAPQQCALEVGSAPGGASYALLLRGLEVMGLDPGSMDPMLQERFGKKFHHLQKTVSELQSRDLERPVEWLVLDINAKPKVTLTLIEELLARAPNRFSTLRGMILTLKINDWKLARFIPEWLEWVAHLGKPFGLTQIQATQLPANKQEICVVARKRLGK